MNTVVSEIKDIPRFGIHWPSLGRWLSKTRIVTNYVTDMQLQLCYFWHKCCEYY